MLQQATQHLLRCFSTSPKNTDGRTGASAMVHTLELASLLVVCADYCFEILIPILIPALSQKTGRLGIYGSVYST